MKTGILQSLRARLGVWLVLRVGLLMAGVLGGALLAAVLLDAALDLPEEGRRLTPWLLGMGGLCVLGLGIAQWRRFEEQRLARLFERAQPSLGNQLINAVQLANHTSSTRVEEFLRLEAVERGRKAA